jgi:predicted CxxxxCH...CXXCH cytochrome family protein
MKTLNLTLILAVGIIILSGCSETKDSAPVVQTAVSVHGVGFKDPSSSNFHAKYIQSKNFDLTLCQSCHGADFAGGTTGQSCNTCHNKPAGPENCTTCHGSVNAAPPKDLADHISPTFRGVGAHQSHVIGGTFAPSFACTECHTTPTALTSPGHIDASTNAEVRFDTTSTYHRTGASYAASTVSCSNTYCHGNFSGGNGNVTVAWTDTSSSVAACGTCHGDVTKATKKEKAFPKTGHTFAAVTTDCTTCHGDVINANFDIIAPTKHVNGKLN